MKKNFLYLLQQTETITHIKNSIMKTTIDIYYFVNEMVNHGFTRFGAANLFRYFELLESEMDGLEIEFDPIAIRCEWTEYKTLGQISYEYGILFDDIDDLYSHTQVVEFDGGIIIQNF